MTPEQIEAMKQAIEAEIKQKIATGEISTQQLGDLSSFLPQLPNLISQLVSTPLKGVTTGLFGLLGGFTGNLGNLMGAAGLSGNNLEQKLVNVIKQEIPYK